MMKLVKNSVTLESAIADIVIRDIRHISGSTTLNECARVLARTKYALVEKKHLITIDDFLQFMAAKMDVKVKEAEKPVEKEEAKQVEEKPQEEERIQTETDEPVKASYLKYAAAGMLTAGLATGAFLLAKNKK